MSSPLRLAPTAALDLRAALRVIAEAAPAGAFVPVLREQLLALVANGNGPAPSPSPAPGPTDDRLLSVGDAAAILGTSPRWLYAHGDRLAFTRKLGRRTVRYSERGLRKWMERQPAGRAT